MVLTPDWSIMKFGQNMALARPQAIQTVGGARVQTPSLVLLPDDGEPGLVEPVVVTGSTATLEIYNYLAVVSRVSPTLTTLTLPSAALRLGLPLVIADLSTIVTAHEIALVLFAGDKIMQQTSWSLFSNTVSLAGVTLFPVTSLNQWVIAP